MIHEQLNSLLQKGELDEIITIVDSADQVTHSMLLYKAAALLQKNNAEEMNSILTQIKLERKTNNQLEFLDLDLLIYESMYLTHKRMYKEGIELLSEGERLYSAIVKREGKERLDILSGIYHQQAILQSYLGELEKALALNKKNLELRRKIGDPLRVSYTLNSLGITHKMLGNYEEAVEYYLECLDIRKKLGNKNSIAGVEVNLSSALAEIGNLDRAIEHIQNGIEIFKELKHTKRIILSKYYLGSFYLKMGRYSQSLDIYKETLDDSEALGDNYLKSISVHSIATIYRDLGYVSKAGQYYQESLRLKEQLGNNYDIAITLIEISDFYFLINEDEQGLQALNRCLDISKTYDHSVFILVCMLKFILYYDYKSMDEKVKFYYHTLQSKREKFSPENIIVHDVVLRLVEAIYIRLENSQESLDRSTAILTELVEDESVSYEYKILVYMPLLGNKIRQLKETQDLLILNEIHDILESLYDIATAEGNWVLLLETKIFESRLNLVKHKPQLNKELLQYISGKANELGLLKYNEIVKAEKDKMSDLIERWKKYKDQAIPISQKIREVKLEELLKNRSRTISFV